MRHAPLTNAERARLLAALAADHKFRVFGASAFCVCGWQSGPQADDASAQLAGIDHVIAITEGKR